MAIRSDLHERRVDLQPDCPLDHNSLILLHLSWGPRTHRTGALLSPRGDSDESAHMRRGPVYAFIGLLRKRKPSWPTGRHLRWLQPHLKTALLERVGHRASGTIGTPPMPPSHSNTRHIAHTHESRQGMEHGKGKRRDERAMSPPLLSLP